MSPLSSTPHLFRPYHLLPYPGLNTDIGSIDEPEVQQHYLSAGTAGVYLVTKLDSLTPQTWTSVYMNEA